MMAIGQGEAHMVRAAPVEVEDTMQTVEAGMLDILRGTESGRGLERGKGMMQILAGTGQKDQPTARTR